MADPLSWLKLGPRSRTPSIPLPTSSPECKATRESHSGHHRRPGSTRMSSHVIQPQSSPEFFPTDNIDEDAASLFVRNQDRIWYNPSLDQMVEALQVSLMTCGVLEPIPIEYNSYILHLIEGFAKARADIRKAEVADQELKQSLEQNLEQFRLATDGWLQKESQYLAEVKRLEVLLSKSSPDGLEAVTLARTNSVVDRSGAKRGGFLSRLNGFKRDHLDGSVWPSAPLTPLTPRILDNDNDFLISEKFRRQDTVTKAYMTVRRERRTDRHDAANKTLTATKASNPGSGERLASWSGEALEHGLNGTKGGQDGFRGPLEAQSPTKNQARGQVLIGLPGSGISYRQENTWDTPTITEANGPVMTGATSRHERGNSGFSFEPGDDCDLLLGNPVDEHGEFDTREQPPPSPLYLAHSTLEGTTIEKCRRRGKVNSLINGLMSGKERRPSRENDGSAIRHPVSETPTVIQSPICKPVRRSRDSGDSRRSMIKDSPSQGTHSRGSPAAASTRGQETPQGQQTETDARIAATLALASAPGSTNPKK
ncbi:hypothetical protein F4859DRAFT_41193 [Xylaria cf. heliscus]|nr:hypothetical protein F4859DRAFT_41193 [Xylaria cf. heliscus]